MKQKWIVISIVLALISTILTSFCYTYLFEWEIVFYLSIPVFFMFLLICVSSHAIIQKTKRRFGVWGITTGVNVIILATSFVAIAAESTKRAKVDIPPIVMLVAIISFALLWFLLYLGVKIERGNN